MKPERVDAAMNTMFKILGFFLILFLMAACGEEGSINDVPAKQKNTISFNESSGDDFFSAAGETVFSVSYSGSGSYQFNLFDIDQGITVGVLARGTGPVNREASDDLVDSNYRIEADANGSWSIDVRGNVKKYTTEENPDDCNCQGCCSSHGGVVCDGERTLCGDGTPLSETCLDKNCIAKGCPGCE